MSWASDEYGDQVQKKIIVQTNQSVSSLDDLQQNWSIYKTKQILKDFSKLYLNRPRIIIKYCHIICVH